MSHSTLKVYVLLVTFQYLSRLKLNLVLKMVGSSWSPPCAFILYLWWLLAYSTSSWAFIWAGTDVIAEGPRTVAAAAILESKSVRRTVAGGRSSKCFVSVYLSQHLHCHITEIWTHSCSNLCCQCQGMSKGWYVRKTQPKPVRSNLTPMQSKLIVHWFELEVFS